MHSAKILPKISSAGWDQPRAIWAISSQASGVTGLIKAALALHHGRIPPTLHYQTPNPEIDFGATPFKVANAVIPWPRGTAPRRAGVSSFGVGGTNAHVVLEEAPLLRSARSSPSSDAADAVRSRRAEL